MKIIGSCNTLTDKRPYLPGILVREDCPKCNRSIELSLKENYPWEDRERKGIYNITFGCDHCEYFWEQKVKVNITLEKV